VTDLHTQLVTVVQRRLDLAKRASYGDNDWTLRRDPNGPAVGQWERDVQFEIWTCDDEEDGCPEAARQWIAEGKHIALHDPADAIRRYEADLRRLDRHKPEPNHRHIVGQRKRADRPDEPWTWFCWSCPTTWTPAEVEALGGVEHSDLLVPLNDPSRPCPPRCQGCNEVNPCAEVLDVAASLGVEVPA
jgi:hypothetical protein